MFLSLCIQTRFVLSLGTRILTNAKGGSGKCKAFTTVQFFIGLHEHIDTKLFHYIRSMVRTCKQRIIPRGSSLTNTVFCPKTFTLKGCLHSGMSSKWKCGCPVLQHSAISEYVGHSVATLIHLLDRVAQRTFIRTGTLASQTEGYSRSNRVTVKQTQVRFRVLYWTQTEEKRGSLN